MLWLSTRIVNSFLFLKTSFKIGKNIQIYLKKKTIKTSLEEWLLTIAIAKFETKDLGLLLPFIVKDALDWWDKTADKFEKLKNELCTSAYNLFIQRVASITLLVEDSCGHTGETLKRWVIVGGI